jgi:hypothetical protein
MKSSLKEQRLGIRGVAQLLHKAIFNQVAQKPKDADADD